VVRLGKVSCALSAVLAGGSLAVVAPACSDAPDTSANDGAGAHAKTGSVGLSLTVGNVEIDRVDYVISGPEDRSGSIPVASGKATISAFFGALLAGDGYSIELTAYDGETEVCSGSAEFSVAAGGSVSVDVVLTCDAERDDGDVIVNGEVVDDCPELTSVFVGPLETQVGGTIKVNAGATHDASLEWTATAGSFADANAAATTYTCPSEGSHTITVTASDSNDACSDSLAVDISCVSLDPVEVQLLGFNDFHGNLETTGLTWSNAPAGGAAYFAAYVEALRATNPNTFVVSAGDMIGGSPLASALFHDEPTIEAFNLIDIDFNAVGNHEFDEGTAELLRMQHGGCHPIDGCQFHAFEGAEFDFLAANVRYQDGGETIFPAYGVREVAGVKIAFIGMTLESTPSIVTPSGISTIEFLDEVETVNAIVPVLQAQGIESIVVLIHEGGFASGGENGCTGASGPIVAIVNGLDPAVDVVVSGHTHSAYNCVIDGRVVTSAGSFGRLVTDIDLVIDPTTRDVVSATATNVVVRRDLTPDPEVAALVSEAVTLAAPLANAELGTITHDIARPALGYLIADAQLASTDGELAGGARVAFMNPGGVRADLFYAASAGEGDGVVRYAEAFTVQPFANSLVVMTLTGAQIKTLLEQQFDNPAAGQSRMLYPSAGFYYEYDPALPTGSRVNLASITLNGTPLVAEQEYRVTVNSFLATGGDLFGVLNAGSERLGGAVDLDAFADYLEANSPVSAPTDLRVNLVDVTP
jgi:5'-nucleotidase